MKIKTYYFNPDDDALSPLYTQYGSGDTDPEDVKIAFLPKKDSKLTLTDIEDMKSAIKNFYQTLNSDSNNE